MPRWSVLGLAWAAGALGSPGTSRLVFDLHPKHRRRGVGGGEEPRAPERRLRRRLGDDDGHPVDLFNLDNVQYVMRIEVGQPCSSGDGRSNDPAEASSPWISKRGVGCSNWASILIGHKHEHIQDASACGDLCLDDADCVTFGYQSGDASECTEGGAGSTGDCLLYSGECESEPNPCWELNEQASRVARVLQSIDQVPRTPMHGGQILEVLPDTGSPDLWIAASNCTNCLENATLFQISKSCTAKQLGDRTQFAYRDGTTASGSTFLDTVNFGDLTVTEQLLIQVDHMDADTQMKSDGIMGLAPYSSRGKTFLTRLYEEHVDLPKQFSFFLKGRTDVTSKLVFGDPDFAQYSKEVRFQYSRAHGGSTQSTWLASIRSVAWTGTSWDGQVSEAWLPGSELQGMAALVDSGTSLMVLAADLYDSLMAELLWRLSHCVRDNKQEVVRCDCPPANDLSRIPWMVITFVGEDGEDFSVCMSPEEFILESPDPNRPGGAQCIPAFSRGGSLEINPIILGMTFLRSFYTNFDIDGMKVGFARSSESPLPAHSMCRPHRKSFWGASIVVAVVAVVFACYVACDSDPGCRADVLPKEQLSASK